MIKKILLLVVSGLLIVGYVFVCTGCKMNESSIKSARYGTGLAIANAPVVEQIINDLCARGVLKMEECDAARDAIKALVEAGKAADKIMEIMENRLADKGTATTTEGTTTTTIGR